MCTYLDVYIYIYIYAYKLKGNKYINTWNILDPIVTMNSMPVYTYGHIYVIYYGATGTTNTTYTIDIINTIASIDTTGTIYNTGPINM